MRQRYKTWSSTAACEALKISDGRMSNSTEEEMSLDVMDNVTRQNSSDPDWRQEEMAAKMVLEGILLPIISSFGFLGKN